MKASKIQNIFLVGLAALFIIGCKSSPQETGPGTNGLEKASFYCVDWNASFFQAVSREAMLEKSPTQIVDKEALQKIADILKGYDVKQTTSDSFDHRILMQLIYSSGDKIEVGMNSAGMIINGHPHPLDAQLKQVVFADLPERCQGYSGSMEE